MMYRIAIVTGGISKEKEISLASAKTYIQHLQHHNLEVFITPNDLSKFISKINTFDIVFPVLHGVGGEDGQITALCELHNVPCFFTSSQSHQLCIDKFLTTALLNSHGILVPKTNIVDSMENIYRIQKDETVFIKPVHGGSSIDTGICKNQQEVDSLIKRILQYDQALVQEYIPGEELTVSLVGDYYGDIDVYAISQIITGQDFFDYQAKYDLKNTDEITPAKISSLLEEEIINLSKRIYQICKLTCLARIDFLYYKNKLYCLEINTIPGFTETSFFPQAIHHRKLEISEFLDKMMKKQLKR